MFDWMIFLSALGAISLIAVLTWFFSLIKKDVSIVDSVWGLFFIAAMLVYCIHQDNLTIRSIIVIVLVSIWGLRLSIFLTWRNWGEQEDYRYVEIRQRNQPNFSLKSLGLVFLLQGFLAWLITLPLYVVSYSQIPVSVLDIIGISIVLFGIIYESIADWQLALFRSNPLNTGKVYNSGLWRYSRHPNYFGEICVWWGCYLIALSAGGAWSILSPILITILILRISGVSLMEKDIDERKPEYRNYKLSTNAFIPGPRRL